MIPFGFGIVLMKMSTRLITRYTGALYTAPEQCRPRYDEFRDMFSEGQLRSKLWLSEELAKHIDLTQKSIAIAGSWFASLAFILLEDPKYKDLKITCIDIDKRCQDFLEYLPNEVERKSISGITKDMYEYSYIEDVVINTSCEHIPNLSAWLNKVPPGSLVVLQSNNFSAIKDHVNCVNSLDEFKAQAADHISELCYAGEINLGVYTRYMIIFKKKTKTDFSKTKKELDAVSPAFCVAKWKQATLHLHNGRTHSCHHPYPHAIDKAELISNPSALHNTKEKKKARKQMLEGARPSECQYCWNVEDLPGFKEDKIFSDRVTKSSESWAHPFIDEISKASPDANINPSYLEVSFSNLCNFKCSYCSPVYSSKWQEEIESHGPYQTSARFNNLEYFKSVGEMPLSNKEPNPYVESFWKWWPDLLKSLRVLRITGGEPLLNANTFKVLDYLEEFPQPQLKLGLNTNGCAPQKLMDQFVSKCSRLLKNRSVAGLHVFTSLDGYGPYAEYGRHGLSFADWLENINKILTEIPQSEVTIMCTTNIFSIPEFSKFLQIVLALKNKFPNHRVTCDTNILRFPHHQNLSIVTEDLKSSFDSSLDFMKANPVNLDQPNLKPGFSKFEINRMERLIQYLKTGPNSHEKISIQVARGDFYKFVTEHDKRRGTDFLKTFPLLKEFYEICRNSA